MNEITEWNKCLWSKGATAKRQAFRDKIDYFLITKTVYVEYNQFEFITTITDGTGIICQEQRYIKWYAIDGWSQIDIFISLFCFITATLCFLILTLNLLLTELSF